MDFGVHGGPVWWWGDSKQSASELKSHSTSSNHSNHDIATSPASFSLNRIVPISKSPSPSRSIQFVAQEEHKRDKPRAQIYLVRYH